MQDLPAFRLPQSRHSWRLPAWYNGCKVSWLHFLAGASSRERDGTRRVEEEEGEEGGGRLMVVVAMVGVGVEGRG